MRNVTHRTSLAPTGHRRRGATLIEALVAGMLLGSVMMLLVPMLGAVARQRRAIEWQRVASQELANQMELITARPWSELTAETASEIPLSADIRTRFPDPVWKVAIEPLERDPATKRVALSLQWQRPDGIPSPTVRLTSFVAQQEETP